MAISFSVTRDIDATYDNVLASQLYTTVVNYEIESSLH